MLAGDKLIEIVIPLVVAIEHDKPWVQLKQLALGRCVLFHRLVIVQVILRQIRHHRRLDRHAVQLVLIQRMTRHLQHHVVSVRPLGVAEKPLHPRRTRHRGIEVVKFSLTRHLDHRCGKHRGREMSFFQNLIDIARRCRLAICPRHRDHPEVL